jgi:hypothetical protein
MSLKLRIEKMLLDLEVSCKNCEIAHSCGCNSHDSKICVVWEIDHELAHNLALEVLQDPIKLN